MLFQSKKTSGRLPPPDTYLADYRQVKSKNEGKKLALGFKLEAFDDLVVKDVIASLDTGPLRADLETIQGRPFTDQEAKSGVDPESLIGKKSRVVVIHKRASGGREIAVVSVILPVVQVEEEAKSKEEARVKAEAEEKAEAEAKAREEARLKAEAEAKAKQESEAKAREEARLKAEAEEKTRQEAVVSKLPEEKVEEVAATK